MAKLFFWIFFYKRWHHFFLTQDVKKHAFFWEETLPLSWNQIIAFFLTLEQRSPQTYLSSPLSFWNNCLTSYDVMSAALTLSIQVPIIKKKSYLSNGEWNWLLVSYFWGLITFKPKIHKVTWRLICNLKVIYKNLPSQYKHLFQREEFALGREETCLNNFSSHCQACQFCGFSMSVHRISKFFLARFRTF